MSTPAKTFQNKSEFHINALREMIEKMPFRGNTSEESQKVQMSIQLEFLERSIDSVEPFDFVEIDLLDDDLMLKDSAESKFNNHPDNKIFVVDVWFNDETDTTTVVEDYKVLVCAENESEVRTMAEDIHGMLCVDSSLFVNIDYIEQVHPEI